MAGIDIPRLRWVLDKLLVMVCELNIMLVVKKIEKTIGVFPLVISDGFTLTSFAQKKFRGSVR